MVGLLGWAPAHPGRRPPGDPRSTPPLRTLCHGHCWPSSRRPTLLGAWSTQCLRLDGGSGEGAGPRPSPAPLPAWTAAEGSVTRERGPHSLRLGGPPGAHSPADPKPPSRQEPPTDTPVHGRVPWRPTGQTRSQQPHSQTEAPAEPPTGGSNNGHAQPARHTVTLCRLPCLPAGRPREPWDRLYGS